jgi:putative DNA primase/helicase
MLAAVQDPSGQTITLHRTYLLNGRKLISRDARKVLSSGISGAAVRLYEPSEDLAICEGIETALAVRLATGKPVWAAISAGNMEKLVLPGSARRIDIYADNDSDGDFVGQAYAYALARRLRLERGDLPTRQVRVFVPRTPGTDWADVWLIRRERRTAGR